MPTLGVTVAVIHSGQILLTKREDFEVWCLPGGGIEAGESVAQAAVREVHEETGLDVHVTRLVGVYSRPRWQAGGSHVLLFSAHPVGGALQPAAGEVLDARYFAPHEIPKTLVRWHRQQVRDALNGVGGSVVWVHDVDWPLAQDAGRQALYDLRDRSGLTRQQFYGRYFPPETAEELHLEVGERHERTRGDHG